MENLVLLLKREFEIRRLMLVVLHIALPALLFTTLNLLKMAFALKSSSYELASVVIISLVAGAVVASLITLVMLRCHKGIVMTAYDVNYHLYNDTKTALLNPMGVTTCFYFLAIASVLYCLILLAFVIGIFESSTFGNIKIAFFCLAIFFVAYVVLHFTHEEASSTAKAQKKLKDITKNPTDHRVMSVEATISDMSVLIVMSVSLISALGLIASEIIILASNQAAVYQKLFSLFTHVTLIYVIFVILLSQIMFIRLRVALAEHSCELGFLSERRSYAWKLTAVERSFFLYLLLCLFAVTTILLAKSFGSYTSSSVASFVYFVISVFAYFKVMIRERQSYCLKYNRRVEDVS